VKEKKVLTRGKDLNYITEVLKNISSKNICLWKWLTKSCKLRTWFNSTRQYSGIYFA